MAALAFEAQDAAGVRFLEASDDVEEGALAAAAWADDGDELAGGDARLKSRKRRDGAEGLVDRTQFKQRLRLRAGLRGFGGRSGIGEAGSLHRDVLV